MDFLPTISLATTTGEMLLWHALREALRPDEGFAFLRYPIFPVDTAWRYEPDILLLHRQLGLIVIEVKDCRAEHVAMLEGHTWRMQGWHSPTEAPYEQAQRQMWALRQHFAPHLGDRLRTHALVALPHASEDDWRARGFTLLPCNPGILHQDQLTPAKLRKRLYALTRGDTQPLLSDADWQLACQVLGLRDVLTQARIERPPINDAEAIAAIRASEEAIPQLDLEQLRIGLELPPGPQRIRGIAGSGKTLLLAMKAARMHLSHPEWDIAFTFHTKSLYQVIRAHLTRFCRHFGDRDPDWTKLRVLHGWGGQAETGLYREIARAAKHPVRTFGWAKERLPDGASSDRLAICCEELLNARPIPAIFDAVLVDEGQDFLPPFYQLAYAALRPPHRLIWAYDEAQSLDHLQVPDAETLFGRDEHGQLRVDLAGQYLGGIWKSRIMRRCYRTPSRILMPAHAFGMGLLRPGGPVQLITTKAGWEDIGYRVESGTFEAAGREVVITRPPEHCPHPLDADLSQNWIRPRAFESRPAELIDCADGIRYLRERGVDPDEILVIALGSGYPAVLQELAQLLAGRDTLSHMADDANASAFRSPGAVTLSGVHRAKGHEAPFVFVLRLDQLARQEGHVASRNQLFVALTRARGLCRVSGLTPAGDALFAELARVLEAGNRLAFPTIDPRRLRRQLSQEAERPVLAPFKRHVPLYAMPAAAGPWLNARVPDPDEVDWVDASALGALDERMFAVRVQGESMAPRVPDGAVAVFQRTEGGLPVGSVVLASVGNEAEEGVSLVIKRLAQPSQTPPTYALVSENPAFAPIPLSDGDDVRIVGVLRGLVTA